jgi:DNA polymerase-4
VDKLNEKFGERTVTFASTLTEMEEKEHRVISPAWRPTGVRKSDV